MHFTSFLSYSDRLRTIKACGRLALKCQINKSTFSTSLPFTALAALAISISYADRSNISTTIIPMANMYNWDSFFSGLVLSSFWIGYGLTQFIGGKLADRTGGENILLFALLAWSILTAATPSAAAAGSVPLILTRIILGAGEGFALPAIHSMVSKYVDGSQRSISASVITGSCYLGALVANIVAPIIIEKSGWESCFWYFAVLPTVVWLPLWTLFIYSQNKSQKPVGAEQVATCEDNENDLAEENEVPNVLLSSQTAETQAVTTAGASAVAVALESPTGMEQEGGDGTASLRQLLSCRPVWAIISTQYCQSWGMVGLLSWLPSYFSEKYNVSTASLGSFTALPYLLQMFVAIGAGFLADYLISPQVGVRTLTVRHFLQTLGMLGPALCLTICSLLPGLSVDNAALYITAGSALSALTVGGVSCNHFDISPRNAGAIFGLGNTAACVGGALAVPASGWVYDQTHSWDAVFLLFAFHYVSGAISWLWLASDTPLLFPSDATTPRRTEF